MKRSWSAILEKDLECKCTSGAQFPKTLLKRNQIKTLDYPPNRNLEPNSKNLNEKSATPDCQAKRKLERYSKNLTNAPIGALFRIVEQRVNWSGTTPKP